MEPTENSDSSQKMTAAAETDPVLLALSDLAERHDGSAKATILFYRELIERCLRNGRTAKEVHGVLSAAVEGFVVGYSTFTYHLRRLGLFRSSVTNTAPGVVQKKAANAVNRVKSKGGVPNDEGGNWFQQCQQDAKK